MQRPQDEDVLPLVRAPLVRVVLHHEHAVDVDAGLPGRLLHMLLDLLAAKRCLQVLLQVRLHLVDVRQDDAGGNACSVKA